LIRQPFKTRTQEELIALLSAVATAILAAIIIAVLYFGRDVIIPVALAILLSFVLAPLHRVQLSNGIPSHDYRDAFGNICTRLVAPPAF